MINQILTYAQADWREHPIRFAVEVACWFNNLIIAIIFNSTVPAVPFLVLYPMWISGTLALSWCAYSRGSFGMLATFLMLAGIDVYGYIKVLLL